MQSAPEFPKTVYFLCRGQLPSDEIPATLKRNHYSFSVWVNRRDFIEKGDGFVDICENWQSSWSCSADLRFGRFCTNSTMSVNFSKLRARVVM